MIPTIDWGTTEQSQTIPNDILEFDAHLGESLAVRIASGAVGFVLPRFHDIDTEPGNV